jgi:hypothetical protein
MGDMDIRRNRRDLDWDIKGRMRWRLALGLVYGWNARLPKENADIFNMV